MYLRKNKVRSGTNYRTYLSIAHNVWWPGKNADTGQSRPVVIACLGPERNVDTQIARELVAAVESCVALDSVERGKSCSVTTQIAVEVRRIEKFLRVLVDPKTDLGSQLPEGPERGAVLEALVRDKLADPAPRVAAQEVVLESVREPAGA